MKYTYILFIIFLSGCQEMKNNDSSESLQRENELLKRENEILRQERLYDDQSTNYEFKTYYNSSRQFQIDYPDFLIKGSPVENGDGRDFISDGGEIRLWVSSTYYLDDNISDLYNQDQNDISLTVTYKVKKENWYVMSGIVNDTDKIFFKKVYFSNKDGGQIRTMLLEYPQSKQNEFDLIIPRIIQSFRDI